MQRIDYGGHKRSSLNGGTYPRGPREVCNKIGKAKFGEKGAKSANEKVKKGKQRSRIEWPGMTILTGQRRETNYVEGS